MFFIRSASEADLKKVQTLLADTWRDTYTPFHGTQKVDTMISAWQSLPVLKERLGRPHSEFLVADDGKQIAGMAYAAMSRKIAKTANLCQLYVHPMWQGQGIGTDLFAEIETCFPDAEKIQLEVTAENDRAVTFYQSLGFAEIGRSENIGPSGANMPGIVMEKILAS